MYNSDLFRCVHVDNSSVGYEAKQFTIRYPDVVPFIHYNTSFPIQSEFDYTPSVICYLL